MKRIALCLAALMIPAAASAQDVDANINLAVTPASYSGCADGTQYDSGDCSGLGGAGDAGPSFVWIVASREGGYGNGIGGAQFGLNHDLSVDNWALCTGGSEIPEGGWPASGTGNAATWGGGCYNPAGAAANIGYLTVGAGTPTGNAAVTGDPRIGEAVYADCDAAVSGICDQNLGSIDMAAGSAAVCGDNCEVGTPTLDSSWTTIKSLF